MPVYIATTVLFDGINSVPFVWPLLKTLPFLGLLYLLKLYFSGASNGSERNMHGKVVIVTVRPQYSGTMSSTIHSQQHHREEQVASELKLHAALLLVAPRYYFSHNTVSATPSSWTTSTTYGPRLIITSSPPSKSI